MVELSKRQEEEAARMEYLRAMKENEELTGTKLEKFADGRLVFRIKPPDGTPTPDELMGFLPETEADPETGNESDSDDTDFSGQEEESRAEGDDDRPAMAEVSPESSRIDEEWAAQFDSAGPRVTFADVAGLEDVKKQIRLRIIAPFKNPEVYKAFKRQGGGGLLLYGPPGCGKTYVARACAGEVGARFTTVSLHEVIDRFWGESEKMMHALFDHARRMSPTVLFFDEFDALGSSRGKSDSQFFRTLVNQLLQEMDGLEGRNEDVLIFAATNMPWNVDPAFRRPGRFDRVLFVPPPDEEARNAMMRAHLKSVPGGASIDPRKFMKETNLLTGADLKALCEQAAEFALERSLEGGKVDPVSPADFKRALKIVKSTAMEWLATARNYAAYANEGGQYDDLAEFLRKVKRL